MRGVERAMSRNEEHSEVKVSLVRVSSCDEVVRERTRDSKMREVTVLGSGIVLRSAFVLEGIKKYNVGR